MAIKMNKNILRKLAVSTLAISLLIPNAVSAKEDKNVTFEEKISFFHEQYATSNDFNRH